MVFLNVWTVYPALNRVNSLLTPCARTHSWHATPVLISSWKHTVPNANCRSVKLKESYLGRVFYQFT